MAAHAVRSAYLQAKVQPETNPNRLILMLYDGALEDIRLAKEGIEQHDALKRGEHLSRAVAIVANLLAALNHNVDVTDEPIAFLRGLYQSMLIALSQVAVTHDVNTLDLASRYLVRLKEIWEHDVMGLPSLAPQAPPPETPPVAVSAVAPPAAAARPVATPRLAYGHPAPAVKRRTVSG